MGPGRPRAAGRAAVPGRGVGIAAPPIDLSDARVRQVFARELVNELRRTGATKSGDPEVALLRVPAQADEFEQVAEAARRYGWAEKEGEEWALTGDGRQVPPPESLELPQVLGRVVRFADPARQQVTEWLPLVALVVGAAAATQEAADANTATLNALRVASLAILVLALGRGLLGELRLLRAARSFARLQRGGFYEPVKRFFSKERLRWVAAFDLAVVATFGCAIFLTWWAVVPAAFALVAYVVVEVRWRTPARRVGRRLPPDEGPARLPVVLEFLRRDVVGRALPIGAAALGVAAVGLAAVVAVLAALASGADSLDEVLLLPNLILVACLGGALFAAVALVQLVLRKRPRDLLVGVAIGVGIVVAALALVAGLWLAAEVRSWFGHRDIPQSEVGAYVTLGLIAAFVAAVAWGVMWASLHLIAGRYGNAPDAVPVAALTAILLLAGLVTMLREPPKPAEALRARPDLVEVTQRLGDPAARYDAMVVIDPADGAGRALLETATANPGLVLAARPDAVRSDVAVGLAVVSPEPDRWRVILNPTMDRRRVVAALARAAARPAAEEPGEYGPALLALGTTPSVRWRSGSVRSIAVLAERPPARRQLAPPAAAGPLPAAVAALEPPEAPPESGLLGPEGLVLDLVLAGEARPGAWRAWTGRTGGGVRRAPPPGSPLDHVEDALARGPVARERRLAARHRPLLLFDLKERRPPLDVDAFLAERIDDGSSAHSLCVPAAIGHDCRGLRAGLALAAEQDEDTLLEIRADPFDADVDEFARDTSQRIYYRLTDDAGPPERVHLDYWIFYRYNDSPSLPKLTCLSGLAIREGTCFDHEGDWEGVTVTLRRGADRLEPEWVTYAGHSWRFRYRWEDLAARGRVSAGHPRVWVARGSHASFPAPCGGGRTCRQLGTDLPDGRRDGRRAWAYNDDAACAAASCVIRLPLTRAGGPAGWGAFGGRWGRPRCTQGLKLCVRGSGPESPFFQKRYAQPGTEIPWGEARDLR